MEQYVQTAPASTESSLFELEVDHELSATFSDMGKWAKFVGIAGFIMSGLILLMAFAMGKALASIPMMTLVSAGGGFITTLWIIMAALFFVPSLFVFNFGRKVQEALRTNDQAGLNSAFANLKLRFKFTGIFYIVIFSIWVLTFLLGLLF